MKKTHFVLGGDLKTSLTEGYTFDFKKMFRDAFNITRSNYLPLIVACATSIAIIAFIYLFTEQTFNTLSETNQTIINFIFSSFIVTPLMTGLQMMGIHHAIGLKSRSTDLFKYFSIIVKLALASVIINVIVYVLTALLTEGFGEAGLRVSLIVMLYLNVTFCMVYPLIAEKKLTPQLALKLSFKLVNKNLRQFILLFLLLGVLFFVSILPSGLGLFLFIPFYFNLMGIVYRQICGVSVTATEVTPEDNDDTDNDDDPSGNHSEQNSGSNNSSNFEA